jgi:hypothetical protein
MSEQAASERITREVTSWPGVEAGPGRRGEFAFRVGRREIGHLHGDHVAHFPAARRIDNDADIRDVIELLRLNYERAVTRESQSARTGS